MFSWPNTKWLPSVYKFWRNTCVDRFLTSDELKYAAQEWLNGQSELFHSRGIKNSRDRYKLSIDKGGDYIEKLMYAHSSSVCLTS